MSEEDDESSDDERDDEDDDEDEDEEWSSPPPPPEGEVKLATVGCLIGVAAGRSCSAGGGTATAGNGRSISTGEGTTAEESIVFSCFARLTSSSSEV